MLTSEYSRAISLLESGDAEEAAYILTGIVERYPRYAAAQVALAKAVSQTGEAKEALLQWSRAEALVHGSECVRNGLRLTADRVFATTEDDLSHSVPETLTSHPGLESRVHLDEAGDAGLATDERQDARSDALAGLERDAEPHRQAEEDYGEEPEWEDGAPTGHPGLLSGTPPTSTVVPEYVDTGYDSASHEAGTTAEHTPEADDQPEWQESGATFPQVRDVSEELPEWESSSAESGDGSDADFDVNLDASGDDVELDRLIDELETARIVPRPDLDAVPEPDLTSDIEDVVSETLARIYATQKQYTEAARVYERLALENPDRAGEFEDKAAEMRRRL